MMNCSCYMIQNQINEDKGQLFFWGVSFPIEITSPFTLGKSQVQETTATINSMEQKKGGRRVRVRPSPCHNLVKLAFMSLTIVFSKQSKQKRANPPSHLPQNTKLPP